MGDQWEQFPKSFPVWKRKDGAHLECPAEACQVHPGLDLDIKTGELKKEGAVADVQVRQRRYFFRVFLSPPKALHTRLAPFRLVFFMCFIFNEYLINAYFKIHVKGQMPIQSKTDWNQDRGTALLSSRPGELLHRVNKTTKRLCPSGRYTDKHISISAKS